jgi:hypothetical protein
MEIDNIYNIDNKLFLVTSKNEVFMGKQKTTTIIYHGTIYDIKDKIYSSGFYVNNRLYKKDGIAVITNREILADYVNQQEAEAAVYRNVLYHKNFILERIHVYTYNDRLNYFYPIFRTSMNIYVGYQIKFNTYGSVFFRKIKFRIKNKDSDNNMIRYVIDYLDTNKTVKKDYENLFLNYETHNSNIFQKLRAQCQNFYNFLPSCIPMFSKRLNENDTLQSLEVNKMYSIQNKFFFHPLQANPFSKYYFGYFYTRNLLQRAFGFFFITEDGTYDSLKTDMFSCHPPNIRNQNIQYIDKNKSVQKIESIISSVKQIKNP